MEVLKDVVHWFRSTQFGVSTTPTPLPCADKLLTRGVQLKAMPGNTDVIYLGNADVNSQNGFVLQAGDAVLIPVEKAEWIYTVAPSNQRLCILAM